MKKIVFILSSVLFFSCNQKQKEVESGDLPYFVFDQVEHYHTDLTPEQFDSIVINPEKTDKELALFQIINGKIPVSSIDTVFVKNMDILGFSKTEIDSTHFKKINELFSKRDAKKEISATCNSYYKDVLIFRNKDKFIGAAKIDFDCQKSQITGARYNTEDFGASGEFKELSAVIK
ncbi:hypothetical protein [Flavobacterium agrisoli]|uniref:Lipoprotein n=1 Tax=Flavobacterium agrisoli TaxID=2793066 RepID=A0A934UIY7_9FLAO|nr:hypothetical protein [Flavobacterium agrisoli]MBK0369406.1 hypothetical protein [Flavobacterium agrisoli]